MKAGGTQSLKLKLARPGIEPRTQCHSTARLPCVRRRFIVLRWWILDNILLVWHIGKKEEIWLNPVTETPTPTEQSKKRKHIFTLSHLYLETAKRMTQIDEFIYNLSTGCPGSFPSRYWTSDRCRGRSGTHGEKWRESWRQRPRRAGRGFPEEERVPWHCVRHCKGSCSG